MIKHYAFQGTVSTQGGRDVHSAAVNLRDPRGDRPVRETDGAATRASEVGLPGHPDFYCQAGGRKRVDIPSRRGGRVT